MTLFTLKLIAAGRIGRRKHCDRDILRGIRNIPARARRRGLFFVARPAVNLFEI
jgi:hypothetical protein